MINSNVILEINSQNLIHNYKVLSKIANKSICAPTIKANAYGIGAISALKLLYKNGCKHFFVATFEEGLEIRKKNKKVVIYILNGLESYNLSFFKKNNLIPIINSIEELSKVKKYLKKNKINFGLHIDTGLNRLGISIKDLQIAKITNLNIDILISHLASADEINNNYNNIQNKIFQNSFQYLNKVKYKSISNSMGLNLSKEFHYNLIRPGISLYGGHFNTKMKSIIKPVICLKAKILQIKAIEKNQYVGYNQTFKSMNKSIIAIIGAGYADGISRKLSNKGVVYYKNKIFNIIGRVSMDTITIDISKNYKIFKEGDYIELINHKYGIDYMAIKCETICDEVLTSISKRVKRVCI